MLESEVINNGNPQTKSECKILTMVCGQTCFVQMKYENKFPQLTAADFAIKNYAILTVKPTCVVIQILIEDTINRDTHSRTKQSCKHVTYTKQKNKISFKMLVLDYNKDVELSALTCSHTNEFNWRKTQAYALLWATNLNVFDQSIRIFDGVTQSSYGH